MSLDKIEDKSSREIVLEGLIRRVQTIKSEEARKPYELLLEREAERYLTDFGHKYKRVFIDYGKQNR